MQLAQSARTTPPAPRASGIVLEMARYMRHSAAGDGACTEDDLKRAGWTGFEIAAYGPAAARRAARRAAEKAVRQIEPQDANGHLEPKPGQPEPPVFAATPESRECYVAAMVSAMRAQPVLPLTVGSLRMRLIVANFTAEAIRLFAEEVFAKLHPDATQHPVTEAFNPYALPLAQA